MAAQARRRDWGALEGYPLNRPYWRPKLSADARVSVLLKANGQQRKDERFRVQAYFACHFEKFCVSAAES
jgi:hypothetical protein